jgi:hypothetical protein
MRKSIKTSVRVDTKEKAIVNFNSQKLLQEKNKDILGYESKETDYDLGHIYGSW